MNALVDWVIIGSDNGLSPARHQAIVGVNTEILSNKPQGTYSNGISFEIQKFSSKKMHFMSRSQGVKLSP